MDTCINGEVEALVGGFGSDGYSAFSNRASPLNSDGNNAHFGVYSRILADQQEFDFQDQGLVGAINQA
ncbi:vacuolating cytotoxin fragment 11 [Helicobacter acinonychis]|nr:vacuolating cytotoxin fragment 11 [Helicobacter acinonychis]